MRLRENKRGRKTAEGRRHHQGAWREPKLFIVYIVDEQGKPEKSFAPLIDAGLRGPDAVFALLRGYLQRLALEQADQVLFVADGAHWIWKRVPGPVKASGPNPGQVHELIDFHHAVKHSGKVAALRKSGSLKQRKARVRKHRRVLFEGQVEQVVEAVRAIAGDATGRRSPPNAMTLSAINTERPIRS